MSYGPAGEEEFMGSRWRVRVRDDLVEPATTYLFADPKFIGRMYAVVGHDKNGEPVVRVYDSSQGQGNVDRHPEGQ